MLGTRQQSLRDGKNQGDPYHCSQVRALREFSKDCVGEGNADRAHPNTRVEKTELRYEETKVAGVCRVQDRKFHREITQEVCQGSRKFLSVVHVRKLLEARERSTPKIRSNSAQS